MSIDVDDSTTAPDLLRGLPAVARHLGVPVRSARNWHDKGVIPTFKIADLICARRSTLTAWLLAAEARGVRRAEVISNGQETSDAA